MTSVEPTGILNGRLALVTGMSTDYASTTLLDYIFIINEPMEYVQKCALIRTIYITVFVMYMQVLPVAWVAPYVSCSPRKGQDWLL